MASHVCLKTYGCVDQPMSIGNADRWTIRACRIQTGKRTGGGMGDAEGEVDDINFVRLASTG
jgi:hypothetical protein